MHVLLYTDIDPDSNLRENRWGDPNGNLGTCLELRKGVKRDQTSRHEPEVRRKKRFDI